MTEPIQTPVIEVTVAAPIAAVWDALRDPIQLRRWHGWHYDGLDAEIELIFLTGAREDAPYRFTSSGGDSFELSEVPDGVRVRITRGPRGGDPEWDAYYDDVTAGWQTFLQQLRFALERHPGVDRRTVFLMGALREPGGGVADRLNIARLAAADAGTPYTATLPTGDRVDGRVWFGGDGQLGLTVDGFGDGLLIVADAPPAPHRPEGGSMAILTTYGLPDAQFDALEAAWQQWWATEFKLNEPSYGAPAAP